MTERCSHCKESIHGPAKRLSGGIYYHRECFIERTTEEERRELEEYNPGDNDDR